MCSFSDFSSFITCPFKALEDSTEHRYNRYAYSRKSSNISLLLLVYYTHITITTNSLLLDNTNLINSLAYPSHDIFSYFKASMSS